MVALEDMVLDHQLQPVGYAHNARVSCSRHTNQTLDKLAWLQELAARHASAPSNCVSLDQGPISACTNYVLGLCSFRVVCVDAVGLQEDEVQVTCAAQANEGAGSPLAPQCLRVHTTLRNALSLSDEEGKRASLTNFQNS